MKKIFFTGIVFLFGFYLINCELDTTIELQTVSAPFATPPSGSVNTNTQVRLETSTEDAVIYYTLDGQTPSANSLQYSTPIIINTDVTIRAIALKSGMNDSDVLMASYTISIINDPLIGEWICDDFQLYELKFTEDDWFFIIGGQNAQKGKYEYSENSYTFIGEYVWTGLEWREWDISIDGNNVDTGQVNGNKLTFSGGSNNVYTKKVDQYNPFAGEWICDDEPRYELRLTGYEILFLVDGNNGQKGRYGHSENLFTAIGEYVWTGLEWREWDISTDGDYIMTGQVNGDKLILSGERNNVYTRKN